MIDLFFEKYAKSFLSLSFPVCSEVQRSTLVFFFLARVAAQFSSQPS
jgi:hypothetical protein